MTSEQSTTTSVNTEAAESQWEVDEHPRMEPSQEQRRDHQPDAYTTGYDSGANTRVGVGAGKGRLERLIRLNEGRHQSDGNHSSREAARDKKRITQSFCSALDVPVFQQRQAVSVMGQLDLDRFGQQKRIEKVALCVIRVIVDLERERYFLNGHSPEDIDLATVDLDRYPSKMASESTYQTLCEQHVLSDRDRYSITQLVKRELKRIEYFERSDQPLR